MPLARGFTRPGLALVLAQVAAGVAAAVGGCSSTSAGSGGGASDGGGLDALGLGDVMAADVSVAGEGGEDGSGGDGPSVDGPQDADAGMGSGDDSSFTCPTDSGPLRDVDPATVCEILQQAGSYDPNFNVGYFDKTCSTTCEPADEAGTAAVECLIPTAFVSEVEALNADAGKSAFRDGGVLACPLDAGSQPVQCFEICKGGRFTEGFEAPPGRPPGRAGKLAEMAYLEAVSVHAFDRLERELRAHAAPPSLVRGARRARRDEVRHAAMMARLARRRGEDVRGAEAPGGGDVRPLVEIAIENAVEGCVRETYSAVAGLVEAHVGPDADVRRAMASIGADECRHAALAWDVAAWVMPRLDASERARVVAAMREAIDELRRTEDDGVRAALETVLWRGVA
jgi:hypothetical protein